ncbi:MAG: tetratricopeptide repeat protein [Bdellovibrionales bacterium]
MEQGNRRWIIRNAAGQIDGPFTTEKVLYKIGRGEFSGDESIAHYPDGKWISITQDPQFYDKLLEVISDDENMEPSEETRVLEFTRAQETRVNTNTEPPRSDDETTEPGTDAGTTTSAKKDLPEDDDGSGEVVKLRASGRARRTRKKPKDIELLDTRPDVWRQVLKRGKVPLLLVLGGLVLAYILFVTTSTSEERIHLIAPQKNVAQVAAESLKGRVHQGVAEFLNDTFDGYIRAENDLVYIVEHNNKNAEVMALLCMTYLQLWPYAHQDSADTKVISTLVQLSSGVDPAGMHSATCRAVDLIVRARFQEAKSLVEAMLDARANEAQPAIIFYFLKGFLLEGAGDHASAIGYLQSAEHSWPQWLLPSVTEAQAQTKLENYSEAGNIYRRVLQANPAHTVSRIELGLLEYKNFNHYDQAERYLNQGLGTEGAPRSTLSRGYFGLAEIALKRGDQSKALRYAQKSFSLNSSYTAAKNLIVQLGGVDKFKKTKVKGQQLLFDGDQFSREGDCQAAQAHYKAAFEEDPKNANAAMKAAQCLWKLSFSTEAIEWLTRAIRADPKLMEAYVTMADYQSQRYNFMAATRILEAAKAVNSKSHEVYRGFAMVELRRGNAAGAINFGKAALQLYENDVETQILLAQASLALKDYKMAYNYAAKAVDVDVNHRKAQIVYAEAVAGLQGVDVGVDYFLKLVNNYPLVTEYRLALGKMLLADERYQQAEEIFRQITKLDEKPKDAYVELAKVLRAQGNMGEALDLLLKAAVLDPSDAEPLYFAGNIYLDLKKPLEAEVQFQRVLTINKGFPQVHFQLGRAALMKNDPREALNQTEQEKRSNPNLADAYLLAAEAHSQMQQYGNCATEYQKAIKLRPQQASIYVKSAQCYRKAFNYDAAAAMLNVASLKESGLADIYKEFGAISEGKGDVHKAIEFYNQYFVLDPDAPDRAQIEERISALQRGQTP